MMSLSADAGASITSSKIQTIKKTHTRRQDNAKQLKESPVNVDELLQRGFVVSPKDASQKLKSQLTQQVVRALWKLPYCACVLQRSSRYPTFYCGNVVTGYTCIRLSICVLTIVKCISIKLSLCDSFTYI